MTHQSLDDLVFVARVDGISDQCQNHHSADDQFNSQGKLILGQDGGDQQGDDVGDLDHRVDSRAGGVFVRIADCVTGYSGSVSNTTFTTIFTVFN